MHVFRAGDFDGGEVWRVFEGGEDDVPVTVAEDQQDGLFGGTGVGADGFADVAEAGGEGPAFGIVRVERAEHVGVKGENDCVCGFGGGECAVEPCESGFVAGVELGARRFAEQLVIIVRADDVERGEEDAFVHHARVFGVAAFRLMGQGDRLAPEAARGGGEIGVADIGEAFERVICARFLAVAVGPLVIAGGVEGGGGKAVEIGALGVQLFVRAFAAARFGVADMDHEVGGGVVNRADQRLVERVDLLRLAIGRIAEGDEGEGVGMSRHGGESKHK